MKTTKLTENIIRSESPPSGGFRGAFITLNLKITIRRLLKSKVFSAVNVFALAIGISAFFVLFLYVANEKSFDKHFNDYQQIYRVISDPIGQGNTAWARSLGIIHAAAASIPEIEEYTQFSHCSRWLHKHKRQKF